MFVEVARGCLTWDSAIKISNHPGHSLVVVAEVLQFADFATEVDAW